MGDFESRVRMEKPLSLTVNGEARTITTDPERPLLDVLRENFHLTGAKYGCGEGQCRACTVLVDGKAVTSCVTSVSDVEGRKVLTIEGLAKGDKLHPVQEAFLKAGAFQCGYCTSGMIMGVVALLNENSKLSEADIMSRMQKHLCRCCSYPRISEAIREGVKKGATAS